MVVAISISGRIGIKLDIDDKNRSAYAMSDYNCACPGVTRHQEFGYLSVHAPNSLDLRWPL